MTTKCIGMKEFRQKIATFTKDAQTKDIRFIILKKNKPVLEVKAINEKEFTFEKLSTDIKKARTQVKKGQVHSQKEIMKEFGLL